MKYYYLDQNPSNAIQFLITGPALIYPFEIANITVDTYTPIIKLNFEINFLASLYGSEVYIYIYIYVCVCVCVCEYKCRKLPHLFPIQN